MYIGFNSREVDADTQFLPCFSRNNPFRHIGGTNSLFATKACFANDNQIRGAGYDLWVICGTGEERYITHMNPLVGSHSASTGA